MGYYILLISPKKMNIPNMKKIANNIRKRILKIALDSGGCYLGQACSSAEMISALYGKILHLGPSLGNMEAIEFPGVPSPQNMQYHRGSLYHGEIKPEYDRCFVSPAHYASVIYCALAEYNRISDQAIEKFNVDGWNMEMIGAEHSPGFETTAGSLGQTISIAAGTAHARKLNGDSGLVYVMLSDGECQEGQFWEALQAAYFYQLDNLILFIDANDQQVEGNIKDVMDMGNFKRRMEAFGVHVEEVDGHNIDSIVSASQVDHTGKILAVICRTSSAHGIPALEPKKPFLHFVRIKENEREEFQKIYESL